MFNYLIDYSAISQIIYMYSKILWIVYLQSARIVSWTFAMVSVLCLLIVIQHIYSCQQKFICPRNICTKKRLLFWLLTLTSKASYTIQFSTAQILMKILCSKKSIISVESHRITEIKPYKIPVDRKKASFQLCDCWHPDSRNLLIFYI